MSKRNILVIGGNGKTGRRVVTRLTALGHTVRIGSRSTSPAFDWNKPGSWNNALVGMDTVYITYQPDLAVPSALQAITTFTKLAANNGIRKMVLLSGRGEKEAQRCEQIVRNAGTDWAIIRADWFNQNFSESFFLEPIQAGHVALPNADVKIPFVDADDIAEVAVAALLSDQHNGQTHELTGPRLLTFREVIAEIAKATGRDIQFQAISLEEYISMLRSHQVPEDYLWLINYLFVHVLDGRNSSTTNGVEKVLGRKARDFAEYAREVADTGIWGPEVRAFVL